MDFVPDVSAIAVASIEVDTDTLAMLSLLGMAALPGIVKVAPVAVQVPQVGFGRGGGPGRRF